jgi:hypothetical protein
MGRPPLTSPHCLLRSKEKLGRLHQKLLKQEIVDLLRKKAIELVSRRYSWYTRKTEIVFNLRPFNASLSTRPFKMATFRMIVASSNWNQGLK